MRLSVIALVCAVCLAGCTTNRTYRPGSSGSPGGTSFPDSSPRLDLGPPASGFEGGGSKSTPTFAPENGPSNGPSLGAPQALDFGRLGRKSRQARVEAPAPKVQNSRYRPGAATGSTVPATKTSASEEPGWSRFYRSTDHRPIESTILGKGQDRVAILGSLHGNEPQSVAIVDELARHLRRHPEELRGTTVLLIKSPNPDGLVSRAAYNPTGVDLNRNFPSANWKTLELNRAGQRAGSEAETRAVVKLLSDFQPSLVVHLKDTRDAAVVNCEGPADDRAEELARLASCEIVRGLGQKTTGSLENYAESRLTCPSLTVLLPRDQSPADAWSRHRVALLSLLARDNSAPRATGLHDDEPDPFEQPAMRKSSLGKSSSKAQPSNRTTARQTPAKRRSLPDFPAAVPDHGYLELPPP